MPNFEYLKCFRLAKTTHINVPFLQPFLGMNRPRIEFIGTIMVHLVVSNTNISILHTYYARTVMIVGVDMEAILD